MENRVLAMKWWSGLSFTEKQKLMKGELEDREPKSLTGREIEILWESRGYF